jgi:hypothetical protein
VLATSAAVALLVWFGWNWLPNDQHAISKRMASLAEAASIKPADSGLARLAYADRLAGFFTTNATLNLEGLSTDFPTISTRSDLREAAMAIRMSLRQAQFKVADLVVTFPGEKRKAKAYVVITGHINQETNRFGQAFRMELRKVEGRWLIDKLKTVEQPR